MARSLGSLIGVLVLAASVAGCGGGGSGSSAPANGNSQTTQTLDSSTSAQLSAQNDVSDSTTSLTVADPVDAGTASLVTRGAQDAVKANASPSPTPTPNPCVSISPLPIVDSNNNGIPDNETETFTNCSRNGPGGSTQTLNGSVNIQDTSSGSTTSWTRTVTNLTASTTGGNGPSFTDVVNGSAQQSITNAGTTATSVRNFTDQLTGTNGTLSGSMSSTSSETITFTAANGATISPSKAPPSGSVTITGTRQVSSQINGGPANNTSYTISTPVALTYDAKCTTPPRITSGQLTQTNTTANHSVTLTFSGCGVPPTVTKT